MNKEKHRRSDGWADGYVVLLGRKGAGKNQAPWYMRHAEKCLESLEIDDPGAATREGVEGYLSDLGRESHMEHWQFRQAVDAVRLLVGDLAGHGWAKDVDWRFWQGERREVDGEHATLYREDHGTDADFSAYNERERGAGSEDLDRTLSRIRDAVRMRSYSIRTEQTYVEWCEKFLQFHRCGSPEELGEEAVKVYMAFLALKKGVAVSTQRQALNSIMFMFKQVFGMELGEFRDFVRARRPKRLPAVLTVEEVRRLRSRLRGARSGSARQIGRGGEW